MIAITRRGFLQALGAAAVGLTLALPSRTWGQDVDLAQLRLPPISCKAGGAMDRLAERSWATRQRLTLFVPGELPPIEFAGPVTAHWRGREIPVAVERI